MEMEKIPISHDMEFPLYKVDEDENGHMKLLRLIGMHDGEPLYEPYTAGSAE